MKKIALILVALATIAGAQTRTMPYGTLTPKADSTYFVLTDLDTVYVWAMVNHQHRYTDDSLKIRDSQSATLPSDMPVPDGGAFNWNGNIYVEVKLDTVTDDSETDSLLIWAQPVSKDGSVVSNDVRYLDMGSDAAFESSAAWKDWAPGTTYGASSSGEAVPKPCYRFAITQRGTQGTKVWFKITWN